jgi:hypothetical protein
VTRLLPTKELTLNDLMQRFQLQRSLNDDFFPEWREDLPELTEAEKIALDRVQQNFLAQLQARLLSYLLNLQSLTCNTKLR